MSSKYATCDLSRYHSRRLTRILHNERILGKMDGGDPFPGQYKRVLVDTNKFEGYSLNPESKSRCFEMRPSPELARILKSDEILNAIQHQLRVEVVMDRNISITLESQTVNIDKSLFYLRFFV